MNGKAWRSGSLETRGSPVHCVVAAEAQCPARGTPWRGDTEVRGDPSPAGCLRGAGRSPRGWKQALATPRDAVRFPSCTQAWGALSGSSRRRVH